MLEPGLGHSPGRRVGWRFHVEGAGQAPRGTVGVKDPHGGGSKPTVGAPPILEPMLAGSNYWDVHWAYDLAFDPWPHGFGVEFPVFPHPKRVRKTRHTDVAFGRWRGCATTLGGMRIWRRTGGLEIFLAPT